MKRFLCVFLWLVACTTATMPTEPLPLLCRQVDTTGALASNQAPRQRYVVILRNGPIPLDHSPERIFRRVFTGFSGPLTSAEVQSLRRNPSVSVYQDGIARIQADTQQTPPWGLDRIDQRKNPPLDARYISDLTGAGVTVYIVDTGIFYAHADFTGRASFGFDANEDGRFGEDCHGHGTHVAGIAAGRQFGVAKSARLVSVRVLSCSGSGLFSSIAAGLEWVVLNGRRPGVVNMSLGAQAESEVMETAVRAVIAAGFQVVMAAGNNAVDACGFSPAREPLGVTVGASDSTDRMPPFSNRGPCLDLVAPGVNVLSAWLGNATGILSGTSMAAPHVTGIAALLLEADPQAAPASLQRNLLTIATQGQLLDVDAATPNLLAFSRFLASIPQPPPPPPPPTPTDIPARVDSLGASGAPWHVRLPGNIPTWKALVTAHVVDRLSNPLETVTVTGMLGGDLMQCVTGGDGRCTFVSREISCRVPRQTLRVTSLTGQRILFDANASVVSAEAVRP